jgi:hypothetical protein
MARPLNIKLRKYAHDLLSESNIKASGLFHRRFVKHGLDANIP